MNLRKDRVDLLSKSFTGELTKEEKEKMENWINEFPDNEKLYKNISSGKSIKEYLSVLNTVNKDADFSIIQDRIKYKRNNPFIGFLRIASLVAILISLSIYLFTELNNPKNTQLPNKISRFEDITHGNTKAKLMLADGTQVGLTSVLDSNILTNNNIVADSSTLRYKDASSILKEQEIKYNKISVPKGGEYNFYLSDGTRVYLNSESEIKFPVFFTKDERRVDIAGEVYFEVTKNAKKPFIVNTNHVNVLVTGTHFSVKAYPDENKVQTTLLEGGVDVYYGKMKKNKVSIEPNEQAEFKVGSEEINVKKVDAAMYISWKDNYFEFEDRSLEEIMNTLGRWYDINVFYQNEEVKDYIFSGRVNKYKNIKPLIDILKATDKVGIHLKNNTIVFSKK